MEWRIIVPLLCLIGILHVPGNAAQTSTNGTNSTFDIVFHINLEFKDVYSNINNNETIQLKQNITTQVVPVYSGLKNFQSFDILAFRNGSIAVEGKLYFNSSDAKPIVANLTQLLHDATFTFTLNKTLTKITEVIPAAVLPNASATAPPPAKTAVALAFKINQEFNDTYSNLSHPVTQELTKNIINAVSPVYRRFPKFLGMVIKKLSRGSIAVESEIQFEATNGTSPNLTEVKNALAEAVASGNVSIPVNASTITATDVSSSNGTVTNTTNSTTNTTVSTTATPPTKIATINVVFKMNQTFNETYSNNSHPDTIQLSNTIVNSVSPFYRRKFLLFLSMLIRSFSRGSIVVDSVLQFDASNGTSPNLTEVKNTLIEAAGNLSFQIDTTSINVTDISSSGTTTATTTSAATTLASSVIAEYNITFKLRDTFTSELANISSPTSKALEKNISDQCGVAYKYIRGFIRMVVRKYSNGSILVDGSLQFNKTISTPTVADLAKILADNVRNGTVTLQIDPTTIKVTDASGNVANKSPVLASMLTAFWMTLASLLLSAVMH
ncbi:uncharacterized protein LOC127154370 [Labeo rohita]|uniref:uncharacterized protein LOC127154370 n=1 Tax=Labeo rohita TaxID=84645 RepID=UPI0021E1D04A|nr:uncharacterized protein LOC127154370 [Labeo rohita]